MQLCGRFCALALLVLAVIAVYWQVLRYPFISIDDGIYVYNNTFVRSGLSLDNIRWAFSLDSSRTTGLYYQPLVWLSFMAESQLFGTGARVYHGVNVFFHVLNTLLLFFLFWKMTRAFWRSLLVAALFALHPVNVESVAWVAEQKNVLNTFFWLLTLLGYWFYAKRPGVGRYALVLALLCLALLSKPMVVTLPLVLLLLDCWPLGRLRFEPGRAWAWPDTKRALLLVLEKAPFFLIIGVYIFKFYFSLQIHDQIVSWDVRPLALRLEHAAVSYVVYLAQAVLPQNLAIFHPYPVSVPLWKAAAALAVLAGVTYAVLARLKTAPYLAAGWFWFVVTLVPVSGIIQGGQWPAYAWRWAYVPYIGLFAALSWGSQALMEKMRLRSAFLTSVLVVVAVFFGVMTWIQAGYWKNSFTLYGYALSVTSNNDLIHTSLGNEYERYGQADKAFREYQEAVRINPRNAVMRCNLGRLLAQKGMLAEAMGHFTEALRMQPDNATIYFNMGVAYSQAGEWRNAAACYRDAARLDPNRAQTYNNLGNAHAALKEYREAIAAYAVAIKLVPGYASAYGNLGNVYLSLGKYEEAVRCYTEALRLNPDFAFARINMHKAMAEMDKAKKNQ
jgi:Tfp pilus assembly protein PilF